MTSGKAVFELPHSEVGYLAKLHHQKKIFISLSKNMKLPTIIHGSFWYMTHVCIVFLSMFFSSMNISTQENKSQI